MEIRHGTSRLVLVGEHSSIKLPKTRILPMLKQMWHSSVDKEYFLEVLRASENMPGSPRWSIRGLLANRREGQFSKILKGIAVPTRSLLCGAMAVQETAPDTKLSETDVWTVMVDRVGNDLWEKHMNHTFANPDNFGFGENERVQLRDFGGEQVPEFVLEHRQSIEVALRELTERSKDK
jgi:hypothetical protein